MQFTPSGTKAIPNHLKEILLDREESLQIWAAEGEVAFAPLEALILYEQEELLAKLVRQFSEENFSKGQAFDPLALKGSYISRK